jgi:hypothetical protein
MGISILSVILSGLNCRKIYILNSIFLSCKIIDAKNNKQYEGYYSHLEFDCVSGIRLIGSVIVNSAPSPASLFTLISPPSAFTIS